MSVNNSNLKKRKLIYKFTFMKWTPERRLSTFERTAIETSLAIHNFGNGATETTFRKLSESVADIKTMIEVAELTFPILKAEAERIMKEKLVALDIRTQEEERAKANTEEAEEKAEEKAETTDKKKTFFRKLLFWK